MNERKALRKARAVEAKVEELLATIQDEETFLPPKEYERMGAAAMREQILEWAERKKKVGAYWHWDEFIEWLRALKVG